MKTKKFIKALKTIKKYCRAAGGACMGCPLLGNGCGSGIMDIPEKLEIKRIKEAAKK